MQDKRFYPYLFLHAGIVTLWVILDRTHKGIANDGAINLLSIIVVQLSRQKSKLFIMN